MYIVRKEPFENGGFPPLQSWPIGAAIPEGYAQISGDCETDIFYQYNGFVYLVFDEEGAVIGFRPKTAEWEAWKAAQPEPSEKVEVNAETVAAAIVEGVNNI